MGIAAYNRGSACIARQIREDARPVEFELMDRLNSLPKDKNVPTPWGPVKLTQGNGGFWVYCPVKGFGYWYQSLHTAVQAWSIVITGYEHGEWLAVPAT